MAFFLEPVEENQLNNKIMPKWPLYQKMHHEKIHPANFPKKKKVKILIFAVRKVIFLRDNWREFRVRNSEHKAPLLEKVGMYLSRMHISMMEKNDLEMINRMKYYVRLQLCFLKKNEKLHFLLLMG